MTDNVHYIGIENDKHVAIEAQRTKLFDDESDLYFPVYERPITFMGRNQSHYSIDDKKAIVRMWSDEPTCIGIVGKNYKVLPTKDLCEEVERTFVSTMTQEQLNGVQRRDRASQYGGTCIRDYIFPNISSDISDKSRVAFRTIVINGYDGSSSFKMYAGAIDFFCENGMVSGLYDMTVRRHTKGLTIPRMIDRLEKNIEIFYTQAEVWKHWVGKQISDDDAKVVFESMPNISPRRVDQLMRQYHIECQSHGPTVWALYSAATFYATFSSGEFTVRETGGDHSASTLLNREKQVRSWLSTPEFEKIAA